MLKSNTINNSTTPKSPFNEALLKGCDEREKKEKRKGKEKHPCEVETSPISVCESNHEDSTQLFAYWQSIMNHPNAKLDTKREAAIKQALKLGYRIPELKKAIDGCKNTHTTWKKMKVVRFTMTSP